MSSYIQENLSKEFDAFSSNYTKDMTDIVPHYLKLMSCLADSFPEGFIPQRILDLGVGNGNSMAQLIPLFPNASYDILDASPEMLSIAKNRFPTVKTTSFESYFSEFDYGIERYDVIIAGFSLHHCPAEEKKHVFKKLYQSLTDHGILSISDLWINKTDAEHPQLLTEWQTYVTTNTSEDKWEWLMEHYEAFDRPNRFEDQKEWMESAGFSSVEIMWNEGFWMNVRAMK